ncbi:MAG: tRNA (adenosine(37)-N6)-threonylcarbamoyltransferase complex dimerization subunit type 1 TsaB [Actinobacteria bacterium]|nr:tRNA (adenosine(37)-N6)-threonylcarbamoyltransferase complex dimerization subunit type 1 TsaB [Actinomycetota bacterium]
MNILGIDSSTKRLSLALSRDSSAAAKLEYHSGEGFMKNIMFFIDRLLKKSGYGVDSVDSFCVNTGPGDFTGTRIGISIAKTLALIGEKPLFGINTLDVFAVQLLSGNLKSISRMIYARSGICNILLVPVIDVRRGEVFFSIYEAGYSAGTEPTGRIETGNTGIFTGRVSGSHLVEYENFPVLLEKILLSENLALLDRQKCTIFLGGTAFDSYRHLYGDLQKLKYDFILDRKNFYPEAEYLNLCAFFRARFKNRHQESVEPELKPGGVPSYPEGDSRVIPYYVREFVPFGGKK